MKKILFLLLFVSSVCFGQNLSFYNSTPKPDNRFQVGESVSTVICLYFCPEWKSDTDEIQFMRDALEFSEPNLTEKNFMRWAKHYKISYNESVKFVDVRVKHKNGEVKDYTFEEFYILLYSKR